MLTEMNQAFLVSEVSGEGIQANLRPRCLPHPTGTECQVSGGGTARQEAAAPGNCWHC